MVLGRLKQDRLQWAQACQNVRGGSGKSYIPSSSTTFVNRGMEGLRKTFLESCRAGVSGNIVFRLAGTNLMFSGAICSAGQIGRARDSTASEFYI